MKLYRYTFMTYNDCHAILDELEVVEKSKTYETTQNGWKERIHKDDIEKLTGYAFNIVILTEPNFDRAKEMFLRSIDSKIKMKKNEIQRLEKQLKMFSTITAPDKISGVEEKESTEQEK